MLMKNISKYNVTFVNPRMTVKAGETVQIDASLKDMFLHTNYFEEVVTTETAEKTETEEGFKCPNCGKSYKSKSTLTKHLKTCGKED